MEATFFDRFTLLCRELGRAPNNIAKELGIPSGSISAWKRGVKPHNSAIVRMAKFFDVDPAYLAGKTKYRNGVPATKEEIMFALFGGDGEITDSMFDEVCAFAQYVKYREGMKKKE